MSSIRVRAQEKDGVTEVRALITHPMETGQRKDANTGELIPAHFIQEVVCKHGDTVVMTALWSGGVSRNPYLSFQFKGAAKGDTFSMNWSDNKGESDSVEVKIS